MRPSSGVWRALVLAALLPYAAGGDEAPEVRSVARAEGIFLGVCSSCHAPGSADAPDLLACEWRHGGAEEALARSISSGVPGTRMIGFEDKLGKDDIAGLVYFLRTRAACDGASSGDGGNR